MPRPFTIRLFEAEPDLARFLTEPEREEASPTELPLRALPRGVVDARDLFRTTKSFGALVVDGMLLQSIRLGAHHGLRLLGPGDLLSLTEAPRSALVADANCRATVPTRLVLLERQFLHATQRWPRLVAGLHMRAGEQAERLVTQLMICQLPRVEDRLLSMMWLLAESWGRVTPAGIMLPVALTHEALGGLIGARRSTVTLALGELTATGSILRRDGGWLIIGRPSIDASSDLTAAQDPRPLRSEPSSWASAPAPAWVEQPIGAVLRETVARLRDEHERNTEQVHERLRRAAATRERVAERRAAWRARASVGEGLHEHDHA